MIIPREHLSLSSLDFSTPQGQFHFSRLYESTIKILDLEARVGSRAVVLIARSETDDAAYALEREGNGRYTLCKLGSWVELGQLSKHATVAYGKLLRPRRPSSVTAAENSAAKAQETELPAPRESKKRRLGLEALQSLIKRPKTADNTRSQAGEALSRQLSDEGGQSETQPAEVTTKERAVSYTEVPPPESLETPARAIADNLFETIRNQYFEALYHSMVRQSNSRFAAQHF
jgi:DNA replication regulator SLD3